MKFVLSLTTSIFFAGYGLSSGGTAFVVPSLVRTSRVGGVDVPPTTATNGVVLLLQSASESPAEQTTKTTTALSSSSLSSDRSPEVDYDALLKYHGAVVVQMSLLAGVLKGLDLLVDAAGIESIPTLALVPLFYALSLKSRVFNPLDNARPNRAQAIAQGANVNGDNSSNNNNNSDEDNKPNPGFGDRIMPSWTPPGVVFPIMWLLIIGPLRAYSSALVYQCNGHAFFHPALLALVFHLSVGDVWNTVNNAERRCGASVTGALCVTASAVAVAAQYHAVTPLAGDLLGGIPVAWFAVATSLVAATWKLNPRGEQQGQQLQQLEPLYPIVRRQRRQQGSGAMGDDDDDEGSILRTKIAWLEK